MSDDLHARYERMGLSNWYSDTSDTPVPDRIFHRMRRAILFAAIDQLCGRERIARALDVGSGEGIFAERLRSFQVDVVTLDYSINYIRRQQSAQLLFKGIQASGSDLPFGNRQFDLVTLIDVAEHIPDFNAVLVETERVTTNWILFSTSLDGIHRRIIRALGGQRWVEKADRSCGHLHVFTYSDLLQRLQKYWGNFDIVTRDFLCVTPPLMSAFTLGGRLSPNALGIVQLLNSLSNRYPSVWANQVTLVLHRDRAGQTGCFHRVTRW